MAKGGRPSVGNTTLNLRVPAPLREHFAAQAETKGVPLSQYLRDVLTRVMAEEQQLAGACGEEGGLVAALDAIRADRGAWLQWQQQMRASSNSAMSLVFAHVPEGDWEEAIGAMLVRLYARHASRLSSVSLPHAFFAGSSRVTWVHWHALVQTEAHSSGDLAQLEGMLGQVLSRADLSRGLDWEELHAVLRVWNSSERREIFYKWARDWVDLTQDHATP